MSLVCALVGQLQAIQVRLPFSLDADVLMANCAWEYMVIWNKDPEVNIAPLSRTVRVIMYLYKTVHTCCFFVITVIYHANYACFRLIFRNFRSIIRIIPTLSNIADHSAPGAGPVIYEVHPERRAAIRHQRHDVANVCHQEILGHGASYRKSRQSTKGSSLPKGVLVFCSAAAFVLSVLVREMLWCCDMVKSDVMFQEVGLSEVSLEKFMHHVVDLLDIISQVIYCLLPLYSE